MYIQRNLYSFQVGSCCIKTFATLCCITSLYLCLWLFVGWQVNYYDLSSRYANILVSISSCFAALAGVITPIVAGEFLSPNVSSCLAN